MPSFGTLGQLFKISPLSAQICHSLGSRGGSLNVFLIGILIFLLLRSPCKISEPYNGILVMAGRKKINYQLRHNTLWKVPECLVMTKPIFWFFSLTRTDRQPLLLKYLRYLKIVAYLSCSTGCTHFARTNNLGHLTHPPPCKNRDKLKISSSMQPRKHSTQSKLGQGWPQHTLG